MGYLRESGTTTCGWIFAAFAVFVCNGCYGSSRTAKARGEMMQLQTALLVCRDEFGGLPASGLPRAGTEADVAPQLLSRVAAALVSNRPKGAEWQEVVGIPINRFRDDVPLDPWGTPYHIGLVAMPSEFHHPGAHPGIILPFVVWSSGPDRRDSAGAGDDLFLPAYLEAGTRGAELRNRQFIYTFLCLCSGVAILLALRLLRKLG